MTDVLIHVPDRAPYRMRRGQRELRIGRAPDQDIILDDPTISRAHGRLFWRGDELCLEDLGSKHGSQVNGSRITVPRVVTDRDTVMLGRLELRIEWIPARNLDEVLPDEETLALPIEKLRGWAGNELGRDIFHDWRKALDLLHETSLHMLQDLASEQFLDDLLGKLFVFLDASRGAVLLRDGAGELALLASRSKEQASEGPLSLSPATIETTIQRRKALLLKEPKSQQPGNPESSSESLTASVMAVPMEHAGEVLGLFYFDASRARSSFTEDDLRFVASLGNLAAAKLLQLRLAEELRRKLDVELELQAVEAAARAKGEFLAHMSHEIRTPMNAILGFTHVAQGEPQTPKAAESLRKIGVAGRSLMGIINDILDLSKIEAGRLSLESAPFRLRGVLQDVVDLLGPKAEEKGLPVEIQVDAAVPDGLVGDSLRLGQVLVNLVGNAVKFTEHGQVQLSVAVEDVRDDSVRLVFSVRDTGIGLTAEQAARLFQPFTQGDSSTSRRYGGTGLGLAISERLVQMMGSSMQVDSQPGAGSTFTFTVWFAKGPGSAQDPGCEAGPQASRKAERAQGRRVLLVEDHALNRDLAVILLEDAGFRVDVAANGFEALDQVDRKDYDVVLMDVEMPGMDGCEAARRIRSQDRHRDLPIIALTAHVLADHRERCRAAGMNDCLTKPVDPGMLLGKLERWTQPDHAAGSADLAGDSLSLLSAVMDVPVALDRLDGRRDLLLHFLQAFLDDSATPALIRSAMAAGDTEDAYRHAHNLKGIAGSLAIQAVADAAGDLEARLLGADGADWMACCDRLQEELERFRACVASMPGPV